MHTKFSTALHLFFVICLILGNQKISAQPVAEEKPEEVLQFIFRPGNDTLYLQGNEVEFKRLYSLVDQHLPEILSGDIPVRVNGYCTSAASQKENYRLAFVRSNRVKSEIITNKKLQEKHFITTNYTEKYQGQEDVVVLILRIPDKKEEVKPEPRPEPKPEPEPTPEPEPIPDPQPATHCCCPTC